MLQFITKASHRFLVTEEVQMAVEGGCRWIQLSSASVGHNEDMLREVAQDIIPMCKEHEAFLVIEDDVEMVDALKVHGVFLCDNARATVMEARERLGANAVIGVYATTVDEVLALKGLDVDYVAVPVADGEAAVADYYARFLSEIREQGIEFHMVALGDFAMDEIKGIIDAGCAGIAVSGAIADAENPTETTLNLLEVLDGARYGDNTKV